MGEFRLEAEEKILLDTSTDEDYKAKFKNRIVVTNQRCIFSKVNEVHYRAKSLNPTTGKYEEIKPEYKKEQEIKLNDIQEVFTHLSKDDGCIKFILTNEETTIFPLFSILSWKISSTIDGLAMAVNPISGASPSSTNIIVEMMKGLFLVDRLVNYINHLIASRG